MCRDDLVECVGQGAAVSSRRGYPPDLTDAQWDLVKDLFLSRARTAGRRTSAAGIVNAICYLVRSGGPWRYLPADLPPWPTVYWYFTRWEDAGVTEKLLAAELTVRGKGDCRDQLPLPPDVGQAVVDYPQHGRPARCATTSMFVRDRARLQAIAGCGVRAVVARAYGRAGVARLGAHRLRHTLPVTCSRPAPRWRRSARCYAIEVNCPRRSTRRSTVTGSGRWPGRGQCSAQTESARDNQSVGII